MTTRQLVYWKPQHLEAGTKEYDFLQAFFRLCEAECQQITTSGRKRGAAERAAVSCQNALKYADRLLASVLKYQPNFDTGLFEKQLQTLLFLSVNSGVTKAARKIKIKEKQLDLYIKLEEEKRKG